jgi:hypothetical protein
LNWLGRGRKRRDEGSSTVSAGAGARSSSAACCARCRTSGPGSCWLHLLPGLDLLLFVLLQLAYHAIMGAGGRQRERRPDSWIDSIGLLLLQGASLSLPPVIICYTKHRPYESLSSPFRSQRRPPHLSPFAGVPAPCTHLTSVCLNEPAGFWFHLTCCASLI